MRYLALCCDYDGTLARDGVVDAATLAALERVVASGRRLVLVTGRQLDDLRRVMPRLDLFERVVAENGALLFTPATGEPLPLAEPPPRPLVDALRAAGVQPLAVGQTIVATWQPHEETVLRAIRDLGLELHVIFNKGAVMILPTGVNKATGLAAALDAMGLSAHNAVGVGDAENDHAFLAACECAVAVANALPALRRAADFVTTHGHGDGVIELVDELLDDDLAARSARITRHDILLGHDPGGGELHLPAHGASVLVAGTSGSGKSSLATALLERIGERGYSFCIIDPEGDYDGLAGAVSVGTSDRAPSLDEAMQLLAQRRNAVLNLVGLPLADRPAFFLALLPRLQAQRARSGSPHWLVIDEAHHLLPAAGRSAEPALAPSLSAGCVQISVHPNLIAPDALAPVNVVVVVGDEPLADLQRFGAATGAALGELDQAQAPLGAGEALVWQRDAVPAVRRVRPAPCRTERRRHSRKYAEGELPPDRSFWFRGPTGKLRLRAQNLIVFLQMADGVDDETWNHHLACGDYSRWFAEGIKDDTLTREARRIEQTMAGAGAEQTRAALRAAIERLYTLPG